MTCKILAFDGSGRTGSINHVILDKVVAAAKTHGAEVTVIDLYDYDLPLYNGDLHAEEGMPPRLDSLKAIFREHDAFLIASPEYNGSFSPLLKNAIDWVSRQGPGETPLQGFKGKIAGLIATSPGKIGGLRGLYQLNTVLWSIGMLVLPEIVSVPFFKDAVDENGDLKNDSDKNAVANLARRIVAVTSALKD